MTDASASSKEKKMAFSFSSSSSSSRHEDTNNSSNHSIGRRCRIRNRQMDGKRILLNKSISSQHLSLRFSSSSFSLVLNRLILLLGLLSLSSSVTTVFAAHSNNEENTNSNSNNTLPLPSQAVDPPDSDGDARFVPVPSPFVPGDGKCMREDLDPETLKGAQMFQRFFVETYLGGNYSTLQTTELYQPLFDFFDLYVDQFFGVITSEGIDAIELDIDMDMEWLKQYMDCVIIDNGIDELEFKKALTVGDPHFTTWQGANFDYHGECDLVLLKNPTFDNATGIELHIRTTHINSNRQYSFVSNAALQIGNDIFELNYLGDIYLNGKSIRNIPKTIGGGYRVSLEHSDKCFTMGPIQNKCVPSTTITITLGLRESIIFKLFKQMIHVEIDANLSYPKSIANGSSGLMGTYPSGKRHGRVARDGITYIDNQDVFGQEWQVNSFIDKQLFIQSRYPQFPQMCIPSKPSPQNVQTNERYLREQEDETTQQRQRQLRQLARDACQGVITPLSHQSQEQQQRRRRRQQQQQQQLQLQRNNNKPFPNPQKRNCILDVMATGDEMTALIYY